jgi:hypothetical protein
MGYWERKAYPTLQRIASKRIIKSFALLKLCPIFTRARGMSSAPHSPSRTSQASAGQMLNVQKPLADVLNIEEIASPPVYFVRSLRREDECLPIRSNQPIFST